MWALLREAAKVSRAWPSPPRSGHSSKSTMPEGPDLVSEWQRAVFAFEEGITVTQMYGCPPREQFTAEQHSSAEFTLSLFHGAAFRMAGARRKLLRATWLYAAGFPPRKITAATGMNRHQIQRARQRASEEMYAAWVQLGGTR